MSFYYDALGNRRQTINGGTVNYLTNSLNQYTSVGGTSYTYDDNGNLAYDGILRYYYDCENRLIDVNDANDNPVASYTYDYSGRRIARTIYGSLDVTIKYAYDGHRIIAEYDANDVLLRKFIYGPGIDEPICLIDAADSNAVYYYHFDGLGSVVALSDVNNVPVERYAYDVFGRPTIRDVNGVEIADSALANPYLFTGRAWDPETALYYYRARYYDYFTGRFLQPDPIGYDDGLNLYTYVDNNPINWIDPWGDVTVALGGGGIGGFGLSGASQSGYIIDSSGNIGTYELLGGGTGTLSLGGLGALAVTSAGKITDVEGFGGQAGGSAYIAGAEFVFGPVFPSTGKPYFGGELSLGINLALVEVHAQGTYTQIEPYFNLKDIYRNPKFAAKRYVDMQLDAVKKGTWLDEAISLIDWLTELYKSAKSGKKSKGSH